MNRLLYEFTFMELEDFMEYYPYITSDGVLAYASNWIESQ